MIKSHRSFHTITVDTCLFQIESLQADNDFAKEQLAAMKGRTNFLLMSRVKMGFIYHFQHQTGFSRNFIVKVGFLNVCWFYCLW